MSVDRVFGRDSKGPIEPPLGVDRIVACMAGDSDFHIIEFICDFRSPAGETIVQVNRKIGPAGGSDCCLGHVAPPIVMVGALSKVQSEN
jgi:hypothetical protein